MSEAKHGCVQCSFRGCWKEGDQGADGASRTSALYVFTMLAMSRHARTETVAKEKVMKVVQIVPE